MAKEYFEKEEFKRRLEKLANEPPYQHEGETYYVGIADALAEVRCSPAADVVEVVRCRDCIHYLPMDTSYSYNGKPPMYCVWHSRLSREDGFCDEGARKGREGSEANE